MGCHRGVRHQGVLGREHQKRRARAHRAHHRNRAYRGRHLQRRHGGPPLQALPAVEGRACRARAPLDKPRERRLENRAAHRALGRRAPRDCRRAGGSRPAAGNDGRRRRHRGAAAPRKGKHDRPHPQRQLRFLWHHTNRCTCCLELRGAQVDAGKQARQHQARAFDARTAARGGTWRIPSAVEGRGAPRYRLARQESLHVRERMLLAPMPALQTFDP